MNEDVEQVRKLAYAVEEEYCEGIKQLNSDDEQHATSPDLLGALENYLLTKEIIIEEVLDDQSAAELLNPKETVEEAVDHVTRTTHSKLSFIVEELISTEVDYLKSLHFLLMNFLRPIRKRLFSKERYKIALKVSNYIKMIHRLGTNFLDDLVQAKADLIGNVFIYHRTLFNLYAKLSRVWNVFMKLIGEPEVDLFIKKLEVDLKKAMGFSMYMLKPMQRLAKYELLLNQIYQNLSDNMADVSGLEIAMVSMKNILNRCNTIVALESIDYNIHNEEQSGFYIMKTDLKWRVKRRKKKMVIPVELFIFEHVVILTVDVDGNLEYRDSILLSNLSRVDHDDPLRLTLEDTKDTKHPRSIKLEAPSPRAKQKCLQSIDSLLWGQLKNIKEQQAQILLATDTISF